MTRLSRPGAAQARVTWRELVQLDRIGKNSDWQDEAYQIT
jgi:hypothetical protein